jgi:hypothetical protein
MNRKNKRRLRWSDDSGAALLMSIMFTLIISGLALTLFATTSREVYSSNSQVVYNDSFNTADAAANIGMLRIKAIMEANDPIEAEAPFERPPFSLAIEGGLADSIGIREYKCYDIVSERTISFTDIDESFFDEATGTFQASIEGFFEMEATNPVKFGEYLKGAVSSEHNKHLDTGESALLRGWRIYLQNDNDGDGKTALLVAIGYLLDPQNNMLYQKRIEVNVYIHAQKRGQDPDPTGQVTNSQSGAKTGRFKIETDLEDPVDSYDLR